MSTGQEFVIGEGYLHVPLIFSAYLLYKAVYPGFPSWGSGVPCYLEQHDFGLQRALLLLALCKPWMSSFFFFSGLSLNTEHII